MQRFEDPKLCLTGSRWINHFTFAFVPLILFIGVVFLSIFHDRPINTDRSKLAQICTICLTGFSFWWHNRALRFKTFTTTFSAEVNRDRFLALAGKHDWLITDEFNLNSIEAKTQPTILGRSQMITVRFSGNQVSVNSILDPDGLPLPVSFWVNLENFRLVYAELCAPNP